MSQKYCTQCGSVLEPGSRFCTGCGTMVEQQPVNQAPVYQQLANRAPAYQQTGNWNGTSAVNNSYGAYPYGYAPAANRAPAEYVSKREYRRNCTDERYRKNLRNCAIWMYILCGVNAVIHLLVSPADIVIDAVNLALILGIHLGKSKGCAIALLCVSIVCVILTLINTGKFGGWWWIIASIGAISTFSGVDKEYEAIYGAR